jgi:glycosyltransferase involved in cell wall biosynthesis
MSSDGNKGMSGSRIAFVLPIGMTLGGSNTWSIQLAGHLAAQGRRVVLIEHTSVAWHPRLDVSIPAGVEVVRCPGPTPFEAGAKDVESFASIYRTVLPAVMVPNHAAPVYAACALLARECPESIRVIGVGHGNSEGYYSLLRYYESILHVFIAKNSVMAGDLKAMLPHRAADVLMHPYVVDVPGLAGRDYAPAGGPLRLTYAGRITDYEKRVSNFIPLSRELHRRGVDFLLRIIGEGGYKKWLQHEVSELAPDLQRRVRIEDMMTPGQLATAWRETDVALLVSNTESGGISLLEAMAQGCIPVSTRTPGPVEFIRDGENGCVVPIDDMKMMAERIEHLAGNRPLLSDMGRRAYETVRDRFSYADYVPWFLRLLDEIAGRAGRSWDPSRRLLPPDWRSSGGTSLNLWKKFGSLGKALVRRIRDTFLGGPDEQKL